MRLDGRTKAPRHRTTSGQAGQPPQQGSATTTAASLAGISRKPDNLILSVLGQVGESLPTPLGRSVACEGGVLRSACRDRQFPVAQTLARHSTITLTMDRYAHLGMLDLTAALKRLPPIQSSANYDCTTRPIT